MIDECKYSEKENNMLTRDFILFVYIPRFDTVCSLLIAHIHHMFTHIYACLHMFVNCFCFVVPFCRMVPHVLFVRAMRVYVLVDFCQLSNIYHTGLSIALTFASTS